MRMFSVTSIVLAAVVLGGGAVNVHPAEAAGALVRLTYTVPPDVKTGDEVTTTLRFVATQDMEQLEISLRQGAGLEILSQPYGFAFANLRKGMVREVEVRVRVSGENSGRLIVAYTTRSSTYGTASQSKVIEYGVPK